MRIAFVAVLLSGSLAAAQPAPPSRADASAAYQEGQRRFVAEDYVGAAAKFEAAYKLDPDPVYLFNIAQAYRLAKDCTKALIWYRKFLADVPKAPNAEQVKKYIAEQEAICAHTSPDRGAPTDRSVEPTPAAPSSEPVAPSEPAPPDETPHPSKLMRNLGIGAIGVGAIGVTMGIVYTFKVSAREDDRNHLCPAPCNWTQDLTDQETDLKRRGERASKLAIASYAVGGVALASGIAMLLVSRDDGDSNIAFVPTRGGAFVSWTFAR